jgi:hypothetical protein
MFKFGVRGRRAGRIALGGVLIAGAAVLAERLLHAAAPRAAAVIGGTWAAAAVAYVVAGLWGARRALAEADELAVPALVLPSVGVALMFPLTSHLLFAVVLRSVDGFDSWAQLALWFTGPTHAVLAILVAVRAVRLVTGRPAQSSLSIYWSCVAVACLPFAIMFMIPPALVALTGLPAIALLEWMERIAGDERYAASFVPRAIVMAPPEA